METTREKIASLTQSKADMEQSKRDLEVKRERLIKELEQIDLEIADVDNKLSQLPSALQLLEAEKQEKARQTYQLHKSIKTILGSAEDDIKEIQDADDIRFAWSLWSRTPLDQCKVLLVAVMVEKLQFDVL